MASYWTWMWLTAVVTMLAVASAETCSTSYSSRNFATCKQLPALGATLAWTLYENNNTIDFAFSDAAPSASGWVGWGINPKSATMAGTQALIAFQDSNGTVVKTYNVTSANLNFSPLTPGKVGVNFTDTKAEMVGSQVTIYATLHLQPDQSLDLIHVWNRGSTVTLSTSQPAAHAFAAENLASVSSITMSTGASTSIQIPHQRLKNRHGIISAVSWGILLPVGVMSARYLRPLSPDGQLWFYVHVTCQCIGYILGVLGWAIGLKLESYNKNAVFYKHRNLGISIFALATLQVMAILLRPKKDHKVRKYWNIYHYTLGYTTIILIIVNIFEGIKILAPGNGWRRAYIVIIAVLGGISLLLEIVSWVVWFRRRQQTPSKRSDQIQETQYAGNGNGNGVHNGQRI